MAELRKIIIPPFLASFFLLAVNFSAAEAGSIFDGVTSSFSDTEQDETDQTPSKQSISINADSLEYSIDNKNVTATGNVEVVYGNTKLICDKLTINTETKDGDAEGNVRLDDEKGSIEAQKMTYNFQAKAGVMIDANFRANPYFGKAEKVDKIDDVEFIGYRTQMSTCSFDHPHYRIKSRKVDFFRGDKMLARDNLFTFGQYTQVPILTLPQFNRNLKKPYMHVQFSPGKRKNWGYYLLTAWRYNLTESISGDILLDYRELFGVAEGFTFNYKSANFGKGDFKFYYTQERDKSGDVGRAVDVPKVFQRYLVRWRHQWDITKYTNLISEYYRLVDSKRMIHGTNYNFLKDYFYREYEKDEMPLSYVQIRQLAFANSSFNVLVQPRANRWYTQLEKLPELIYTLPGTQIFKTPLYFENTSALANYNYKYAVPSPSSDDISMTRLDINNKLIYPMKVAFIQFSPYVRNEITYYNDDIYGSAIHPRVIFYSGASMSTKFYRIFNVKTGLWGLDINSLRHIITPTASYSFNNTPTIPPTKLKQIDSVDAINAVTNQFTFELSNKLQTKRSGQSVDLLDFRINNSYSFKSSNNKAGGTLSDFLLYLDILPYSWMSLHSDATFARSGHHFTQVNADLNFNFGTERTIGFGNRYTRAGSKELVFQTEWRLNPKWKVKVYERLQYGSDPSLGKGLREQEYTVSRDLHCWVGELTWNVTKSQGESVWLIFRLKAFPELEFNFDQTYHMPKPGSQSPESPTN